jgi:hypothetical protein
MTDSLQFHLPFDASVDVTDARSVLAFGTPSPGSVDQPIDAGLILPGAASGRATPRSCGDSFSLHRRRPAQEG